MKRIILQAQHCGVHGIRKWRQIEPMKSLLWSSLFSASSFYTGDKWLLLTLRTVDWHYLYCIMHNCTVLLKNREVCCNWAKETSTMNLVIQYLIIHVSSSSSWLAAICWFLTYGIILYFTNLIVFFSMGHNVTLLKDEERYCNLASEMSILKLFSVLDHVILAANGKWHFGFKYNLDRGTTHPKFDPTRVQTLDLQIFTVHFMSLRHILAPLGHQRLPFTSVLTGIYVFEYQMLRCIFNEKCHS